MGMAEAYERATDAVTAFANENVRAVRASKWLPLVGGAILLSRARGFRRVRTAAAVPREAYASHWSLRGRIVRVPHAEPPAAAQLAPASSPSFSSPTSVPEPVPDPLPAPPADGAAEFYFFHSPLLRQVLWFTPSRDLLLGEDAVRCRLAGVRLRGDADEEVRRLLCGRSATVTLVEGERGGDGCEEGGGVEAAAARVTVRLHGGGGDAALSLVRSGAAVTDPGGAGARTLAREWPRYWRRLTAAEEDRRAREVADGIVNRIKRWFGRCRGTAQRQPFDLRRPPHTAPAVNVQNVPAFHFCRDTRRPVSFVVVTLRALAGAAARAKDEGRRARCAGAAPIFRRGNGCGPTDRGGWPGWPRAWTPAGRGRS